MSTETPLETARRVWPGAWEAATPKMLRLTIRPDNERGERSYIEIELPPFPRGVLVQGDDHRALVDWGSGPLDMERLLLDTRAAFTRWLAPMVAAAQQVEATDPAVMELPAPLPIGPEVWPALLARVEQPWLRASMEARRALGLRRYGQTLHRDDGRPSYVDALQEALDLAVYLERDLLRATEAGDTAGAFYLESMLTSTVDLARRLRCMLAGGAC